MKIQDIIDKLIDISCQTERGKAIDKNKTRDKILFGNSNIECTGIVTTCFASVDVIKKTAELGCNMIIVHEALFWNRGDYTDWLEDNQTYLNKRYLLEQNNLVVWRYHDYIHSGIPIDGEYRDGIFYGISSMLGWNNYLVDDNDRYPVFEIPETKADELAHYFTEKFNLNGLRIIGNTEAKIKKLHIPYHMFGGEGDNPIISKINNEKIDAIMSMELVDFTVSEYIRDAAMLGEDKCIFAIGHYNLEELGMAYLEKVLPKLLKFNLPVKYVKSVDGFKYIEKKI